MNFRLWQQMVMSTSLILGLATINPWLGVSESKNLSPQLQGGSRHLLYEALELAPELLGS